MDSIELIYRREAPQVLATLIRLLGGFDLAEEALQLAFLAAAQSWPAQGMPRNPRAWLISTGRFKVIDMLRQRARFRKIEPQLQHMLEMEPDVVEEEPIADDMLRLVFVCCHPALPPDAQIALCLREVCGLTTEAIAAAFVIKTTTVAQRIVRAKGRIREEQIAYIVPEGPELETRLESVLRVIYLLFSEGYAVSAGDNVLQPEFCDEAIRLARLLRARLDSPDIAGLLALMLLQHARRHARIDKNGDIVLLPDQDRGLWDRAAVAEGLALTRDALARPPYASETLQAAISAVHTSAINAEDTNWAEIVRLYDLLVLAEPGAIVELNRAIAIGMRDGPAAGLVLVDNFASGVLRDYKFVHFARADFLTRLGRTTAAIDALKSAAALSPLPAERRFIERRLRELEVSTTSSSAGP